MEEMTIEKLVKMKLKELQDIAQELKIEKIYKYSKEELLLKVIVENGRKNKVNYGFGELDILGDGYGFLRNSSVGNDIYISASQINKFSLRIGDMVVGEIREPVGEEKNYAILKISLVNGMSPEKAKLRPKFDELIPCYPTENIKLETGDKENSAGRIIDIISPIGKGQRGLIVAPPKAGKTNLIKGIANSIIENHPEIKVWILLVDERPEEVTDIKETVNKAEVFASTFDEDPKNHIQTAEMVLEKAKRLLEEGHDVVILMDSITRLTRAQNILIPSSGKLISGGIDPGAFYFPKKFFGAARNIRNGGSLTIIATALVDTGSKMDEVIYEEFKGTGNMEIILDRGLSELRIFPAIDIKKSGTRKEELLISEENLKAIWRARRYLAELTPAESLKRLIDAVQKTKNNQELLNNYFKGGKIE